MSVALAIKPIESVTVETVTKTRGLFQIKKETAEVWTCSTVIYDGEKMNTVKMNAEGVVALFALVGLEAPSMEVESVIAEFVDCDVTPEQISAFCLRMSI